MGVDGELLGRFMRSRHHCMPIKRPLKDEGSHLEFLLEFWRERRRRFSTIILAAKQFPARCVCSKAKCLFLVFSVTFPMWSNFRQHLRFYRSILEPIFGRQFQLRSG